MRDQSGRGPSEMEENFGHETDELIDSVARELRRPAAVGGADFTARLMAEVERGPRPGAVDGGRSLRVVRGRQASAPARAVEWLTRTRTLRMSPLIGLAAAAGIAALAVLVTPERERIVRVPALDTGVAAVPVRDPADGRGPGAGGDSVEFVLHAPDARSVAVAGDFNDWNPSVTPLLRRDGGLWVAKVPLPAGRYEYTFVVDGATWMPDPAAPAAAAGDFGATNSLLVVGGAR